MVTKARARAKVWSDQVHVTALLQIVLHRHLPYLLLAHGPKARLGFARERLGGPARARLGFG